MDPRTSQAAADLKDLPVSALLRLQAATSSELAARRVVRARPPSITELAVLLVAEAYDGQPADQRDAGCEVIAGERRIVVRAKAVGAVGSRPRWFTPIPADDFDTAVLLLVDATSYDVVEAIELGPGDVREVGGAAAPYKLPVGSGLTSMSADGVVDVTERLTKAFATIDAERFARRAEDDGSTPSRRPTGWCQCGCGRSVDQGALFYRAHDRRAESSVLRERYGSVAGLVIEPE